MVKSIKAALLAVTLAFFGIGAYADSKNLDVDLEEGYIHRSYIKWVNALNKSIYTFYLTD